MKKYVKPELEETILTIADIIQTSETEPMAVRLKTVVNDKEGMDFGAGDVSLID